MVKLDSMIRSLKQILLGCYRTCVTTFDVSLFLWLILNWIASISFYPIATAIVCIEYVIFRTYFNLFVFTGMYIVSTLNDDSHLMRIAKFIVTPLRWSFLRTVGTYSIIPDPEGIDFERQIELSHKMDRHTLLMSSPHGLLTLGTTISSLGINKIETGTGIELDTQGPVTYPSIIMTISPILVANPMFYSFIRLIGMAGIIPITNKAIEKTLIQNTHNLGVISGGFYDMQFSSPDKYMIYTGKWKYYIKRALKYDYDIAFKWIFGENDMYRMFPSHSWCKRIPFLNALKRFGMRNGICLSLFYGRWYGFYPAQVNFKVFGYHLSTKQYTDVLKKLVVDSDQYKEMMNKQVDDIYNVLKEKTKVRMADAMTILEKDEFYGNRGSTYAFVETDADIKREFC